jgi:polyphosphate kinase 2
VAIGNAACAPHGITEFKSNPELKQNYGRRIKMAKNKPKHNGAKEVKHDALVMKKVIKKPKTKAKKGKVAAKSPTAAAEPGKTKKIDRKSYEKKLLELQIELVKLQEWVKAKGLRVVVLFEGRDAAGKGGAIKRITECLNPRVCRVAALGKPTDRERTQWYFQRYVAHLPAGGEIVLFDRSWYNRAGVERVMGFCSHEEYVEFLRSCPEFEDMLQKSGIILIKYWFSVSDEEQEKTIPKTPHQSDQALEVESDGFGS